jgi:hypothetical protein
METLTSNPLPQPAPTDGLTAPQGTKLTLGKRLCFSLMTLGSMLIALIIAGEIVLRLFGWPATGYYLHGRGPLEMLPPGQPNGWYPANELGEIRAFDFSNSGKTNSLGFRDRELVPMQSGEHRIGLIGDSMVAGHGVEQNERFMELWFDSVEDKPENATVWNLGISGTGTCDQVPAIEQLVDIYELDEVILALFSGNELVDNEAWRKNHQLQDRIKRGEVERASSHGSVIRRWLRENSRLATYM